MKLVFIHRSDGFTIVGTANHKIIRRCAAAPHTLAALESPTAPFILHFLKSTNARTTAYEPI